MEKGLEEIIDKKAAIVVGLDGSKKLSEVGKKLYYDKVLSPEELEVFLGDGMYELYLMAYDAVKGQTRKCGNAAIAHMVECGERAKNLGFGPVIISTLSIHDVIEASAKHCMDVPKIEESIKQKFGEEIAKNVSVMSNYYSLITECLQGDLYQVGYGDSLKDSLLNLINTYKDRLHKISDSRFDKSRFDKYFDRLFSLIQNEEVNLNVHTIFDELKSKTYGNYIVDLFKDASDRLKDGEKDYDVAIIAKGIDNIDNLRTMSGGKRSAIDKTLNKVDLYLKYAEGFMDIPDQKGKENEKLLTVYEGLKDQVIEQLLARKHGLEHRNDPRYITLKEYIGEKIMEFSSKYSIDISPIEERLKRQPPFSSTQLVQ